MPVVRRSRTARTHRELTDEDIGRIAASGHAWRLPARLSAQEKVPNPVAQIRSAARKGNLE